jgi:hypothetical protein
MTTRKPITPAQREALGEDGPITALHSLQSLFSLSS